jgi:hypothetical protein
MATTKKAMVSATKIRSCIALRFRFASYVLLEEFAQVLNCSKNDDWCGTENPENEDRFHDPNCGTQRNRVNAPYN